MALGIKSRQAIQDGVDAQKEFDIGNVKGIRVYGDGSAVSPGRLLDEHLEMFKAQLARNNVRYVLYSYNTPIAWVLYSGDWIVPDVKYSVTTSMHQGVVKVAIGNYDFWNKLDR